MTLKKYDFDESAGYMVESENGHYVLDSEIAPIETFYNFVVDAIAPLKENILNCGRCPYLPQNCFCTLFKTWLEYKIVEKQHNNQTFEVGYHFRCIKCLEVKK